MTTSEIPTGTLDGIGCQDYSLTKEKRVIGPPGTGKTTKVGELIGCAADQYGSDAVLVTSFSRAAAEELVSRHLPIDREMVGTLHSHCFHALGKPLIAEAHGADWNRVHPALALTPVKQQRRLDGEESVVDEDGSPIRGGDALLQELNRYRGMMIAPELWPARVRDFERKWSRHKRDAGLLDFTDLIATCVQDVSIAPGKPSVIFADEAQDLNPMQLALLRRWESLRVSR